MKIVYCIAGIFNSGGMERVLANKANYFADQGHEVFIITTDQDGRSPYFHLNPSIQHIDLKVNYFTIQNFGILSKISAYARLQRKHHNLLRNTLHELKADIVISMFDHEVSFLWKIKDGAKKILEIHFSKFKRLQYSRNGIWKLIDQYRSWKDEGTVKKYDKFVVLTHEDKAYWGNLPNILVIPNANSFEPTSSANLYNKKVLAVGRYDYQKKFEDLIEAWKLLDGKNFDWMLNIYGHGELKETYEKLIRAYGLQNQVQLCAPTNNIESVYMDHAIIAMSSRYEGLPMALLEAQACGLPLVSYACKCGPRDIIVDAENGFLIPEGDIKSLSDRLNELMNSEDLRFRMGSASKQLAKRFSKSVVMNQWNELFGELINTK